MGVKNIKERTGWVKVADDNQKENYIYVYVYKNPQKGSSKITIVPRNLLPSKYASLKYGVHMRLKKAQKYCGGSNTLSEAIEIADRFRQTLGEVD
jgi:hypothetical protein